MIVLGGTSGFLSTWSGGGAWAEERIVPAALVSVRDASFAEKLAAREVRRYIYLRTGQLLPIRDCLDTGTDALFIVSNKTSPIVREAGAKLDDLGSEQYLLAETRRNGRPIALVAGATRSARSTGPIAWPSTWACGSTFTVT
jgi:hypothetical protein